MGAGAAVTVHLSTLAVLLGSLATTVEMRAAGVLTGFLAGIGCGALVAFALVRGDHALGRADALTLARVTISCALAGLAAESWLGRPEPVAVGVLAVAAIATDAVDGLVARGTGSTTAFGARFDGEADAFLILVLSAHVGASYGGWILALGATRYAFAVAGWVLGWRPTELPPRYWRKVVTVAQFVALTLAAVDVAPRPLVVTALVAAAVLLAESFARDVTWLCLEASGRRARAHGQPSETPLDVR